MSAQVRLHAENLRRAVADIFAAAGVAREGAELVAEDLVATDVEGVASHGVMLIPMYVERIKAGSVSTELTGEIVSDRQAAIVIDAKNALGQLTARQAVDLAAARAVELGMATVAIRNAFHFGTAGRYARMLADRGCVGIIMSNTRPLMPPPGGAEAVTGNNPLAIAVPGEGDYVPEVDMALSATAMGKIRNAVAAGQQIPRGWATDKDGAETTDPNAAIAGMLLPAAGPRGFGLAFMIDLLTGGLSGGAIGAGVKPLFSSLDQPYMAAPTCSSPSMSGTLSMPTASVAVRARRPTRHRRSSARPAWSGSMRQVSSRIMPAARPRAAASCRGRRSTVSSRSGASSASTSIHLARP